MGVLWGGSVGLAVGLGHFASADVLAFDSNRTGNYEIYLLDLPTGVMLNLTHHAAQDRHPAWSADGRFLAFESVQRGTGTGIYLIDLQRLDLPPYRLTPPTIRAVQPAWSPNGNYIAFSGAMDDMFNNEIFLINLYDKQMIRVTNSPFVFDYGPSWSPDGAQIVYGVYDSSVVTPSDVMVVDFQEIATQLAQARPQFVPVRVSDAPRSADPTWTPEGVVLFVYTQMLWQTEPTADHMDAPLADFDRIIDMPDVSSDGDWVAFASANSSGDLWRELYVARRDGSVIFPVTFGAATGGFWDNSPAWKPR